LPAGLRLQNAPTAIHARFYGLKEKISTKHHTLFFFDLRLTIQLFLHQTACAIATTNLQPKPAAEPEIIVSAKNLGRWCSRAVFPSSFNFKKTNFDLRLT
jgi:hypothetical protein